jgi:hypothetical protein
VAASVTQLIMYLPFLLLVVVAGLAVMIFNRNARLKRVVLPITMALIFAALVVMLWIFTRGHLPWAVVAVPLILMIMFYRSIVICPSCGNTVRGRGFRTPLSCTGCNAQFGGKPPA